MGIAKNHSHIWAVLQLYGQSLYILKLLKSGCFSLIFLFALASLTACESDPTIVDTTQGSQGDDFFRAPPDTENRTGNFTDGDMDNMTGGGGGNSTDGGDTGDGSGNSTDGGGDTGDGGGNSTDGGDTGDGSGNSTDGGDTGDDSGNSTDGGDTGDGSGNSTDGGGDTGDMGDGSGNSTDGGDTGDGGGNSTDDGGDTGDGGDIGGGDPVDPNSDFDRDGVIDRVDIDNDGDGLIEIFSADGLDAVRFDLNGFSLAGITTGCGGKLTSQGSSCTGYELTADIDMAGYMNWEPIGHCADANTCPSSLAFRSIFEGNNYEIRNLNLEPQSVTHGLGLFGSIFNANIRNLVVDGLTITNIAGGNNMGLIGASSNSEIQNVHVHNISIDLGPAPATYNNVGGLIGRLSLSTIFNNSVIGSIFSGTNSGPLSNNIGGLIGSCRSSTIYSVATQIASLDVNADVLGGLIGYCTDTQISGASSHVGTIRTRDSNLQNAWRIGGLIGELRGESNIYATYSHVNQFDIGLNSNTAAGGLIGATFGSPNIQDSYAITNAFAKGFSDGVTDNIGGLIGEAENSYTPSMSYWDERTILNIGNFLDFDDYGEETSLNLMRGDDFDFGTNIYAGWDINQCNPQTFASARAQFVLNGFIISWDLGTREQYPALNCSPFSLNKQRTLTNNILLSSSPL